MRFLVAAIVLSLLTQVGYTQQTKIPLNLPKDWKYTADDAIKQNPDRPLGSNPSSNGSPSSTRQSPYGSSSSSHVPTKTWLGGNMGKIIFGVIVFVVCLALLTWLKHSASKRGGEAGWQEVLMLVVVIGLCAGAGVFLAILRPAALGATAAWVVSFLVKSAAKQAVKTLD